MNASVCIRHCSYLSTIPCVKLYNIWLFSDKITDNELWAGLEEQQNISMIFGFITALLGSFLGCILIIIVVFLCFRSGKLDNCTPCQYYCVSSGINDGIISRTDRETNNTRREDDAQSRGNERDSFRSRGSNSDCTSLLTTDSQTLNVQDTSNIYDTCCPSSQPSWTSDCTRAIGWNTVAENSE